MGGTPTPADRGAGRSLGPKVGVIALQGAFAEHAAALEALGAHAVLVRDPGALAGVDAIVLPGGESTTMSLLLGSSGVGDALGELLHAGVPAFGTCAGLILLAREVTDGPAAVMRGARMNTPGNGSAPASGISSGTSKDCRCRP